MLTPFGIALRKIRLDRGLRLLDLASKLGQTSSFISAVETGKKAIPRGYVNSINKVLVLTTEERQTLQRAVDQTKPDVSVDKLPSNQREIVAAFARKLDELPPDVLEEVKKHIFKSVVSDVPFQRKRRGVLVPPASAQVLRSFADQIRSIFINDNQVFFPIMDVLEFRLPYILECFYLDVCSTKEMGGDEGRVVAGSNCIKLRRDVYEKAWNGCGRDRFTACHELGHFLLHRQVTLARVRDDKYPVYRDSEWQADTFAGALLFSKSHLGKFVDFREASLKCGMTEWAANVMWTKHHESEIK